jgi:translation initiation factor IF-3
MSLDKKDVNGTNTTSSRTRRDEGPMINERIRFPQVQLITHEGQNVGVVTREQALQFADAVGLDLVVLNDTLDIPLCKVMDYGKVLYERKKKQNESKKKQKVIQVKEVKLRPKISEHDYETKIKQAIQFMQDGKRVKMTLCFRGRENVDKNQRGNEFFDRIEKSFEAHGLKNLSFEKDIPVGQFWSRIFYIK